MHALTALCGTPWAGGGLLAGLFVAGAAGSVMHCAPMCGGFVLGQVADRMAALPASHLCEWRRVGTAALLPYHLGRLTTYAALGAVAGLAGATLSALPWFAWFSNALLLGAALLFLLQGLRRAAPRLARWLPALNAAPRGWARNLVGLARGRSGFALGLMLGFLPCGLLYAALTVAAASAQPALGMAGMLAFGLGTVPALMVVGVLGQVAGRRWQRGIGLIAPAVLLLNAMLLLAIALQRLAMA